MSTGGSIRGNGELNDYEHEQPFMTMVINKKEVITSISWNTALDAVYCMAISLCPEHCCECDAKVLERAAREIRSKIGLSVPEQWRPSGSDQESSQSQ